MADNRTTELLPCPFCGGEAKVYEMQYGVDGQYSVFGVFCVDDSNSELIGLSKYQHGHFIDNFPTTDEAIAAWNARSDRGTLTADDIRGLIERHSDESGGNGRDFHNGAYVAIADELNARAERTCEEIVRCRDCKHYKPWVLSRPENGGDCVLNKVEVDVWFDGFCAWGERRDT